MSARWGSDEDTSSSRSSSNDYLQGESFNRSRERSLDAPSNVPAYRPQNPLVARLEKHVMEPIIVSSEDLGRNKRFTLLEVFSQGETVMLRLQNDGDDFLVNLNSLDRITFTRGR